MRPVMLALVSVTVPTVTRAAISDSHVVAEVSPAVYGGDAGNDSFLLWNTNNRFGAKVSFPTCKLMHNCSNSANAAPQHLSAAQQLSPRPAAIEQPNYENNPLRNFIIILAAARSFCKLSNIDCGSLHITVVGVKRYLCLGFIKTHIHQLLHSRAITTLLDSIFFCPKFCCLLESLWICLIP